MRQAPKWRSFLPTGRELRFQVNGFLSRKLPALSAKLNLHMVEADWASLDSLWFERWEEKTGDPLSQAEVDKYSAIFSHENGACGVLHDRGDWTFELVELRQADVLTHTGQVIEPISGSSLSAVNRLSVKPAKLNMAMIEGPVVSLIQTRKKRNYFHFTIEENVHTAAVLEKISARYETVTALIRSGPNAMESVFLNYLKERFPGVQFVEVADDQRLRCQSLIAHRRHVTCPFRSPPNRRILSEIVDFYRRSYGITIAEGERKPVLISRRDAKVRQIENEEALYERLKPFGAIRICPGELSHSEQVAVFSNASLILSTHGAGLTNLIYARSGTAVIEIMGRAYNPGFYMWLSHLFGCPYEAVITPETGSHQHLRLTEENIEDILAIIPRCSAPSAV